MLGLCKEDFEISTPDVISRIVVDDQQEFLIRRQSYLAQIIDRTNVIIFDLLTRCVKQLHIGASVAVEDPSIGGETNQSKPVRPNSACLKFGVDLFDDRANKRLLTCQRSRFVHDKNNVSKRCGNVFGRNANGNILQRRKISQIEINQFRADVTDRRVGLAGNLEQGIRFTDKFRRSIRLVFKFDACERLLDNISVTSNIHGSITGHVIAEV